MTDREVIKLCAKAMELCVYEEEGTFTASGIYPDRYNPLHNDAQALAIVKKLKLTCWWTKTQWQVTKEGKATVGPMDDLNRAICECAAKVSQELNAQE